ncbi:MULTISPECIES: hypothetical protein [Acidobacteriaceae]|uniref:hypothetical protein n=1 Tax=Acidobacteriaceae TaxID=204434 RepID=UPI00131D90BB|nr:MULTISPECIES: hypothetical protein [Acidobacteriaceae]MDW5265232.1 hypothetical protein [Edaphobacter sp.]
MKLLRTAAIGIVFLIGASGILCKGQMTPQVPSDQQASPARQGPEMPPMGPSVSPQMQEQQARSRNSDRQKKLVEDTDKLLALATQLKQDVDKTNKDVLSLDVIKKADEIEKLAHSVKERMKE